MSLFGSKLTYGDFYRTGVQDCGNALQYDDFDLRSSGTPTEIVDKALAEWEADGMEEQWLEQQDDFEGLDARKCYESWKAGWRDCAISSIGVALERVRERQLDDEQYERERENPATVPLRKLFAWRPKVEQTIVDVNEGRTSFSSGQPIMVSRLDAPRGAYWIMDGHHRAVEAALAGQSKIAVEIEPTVPRIERTGGAYKNVLDDRVNVAEFIEAREHENPPPKHWWRRPSPAQRLCYRTKADALKAFLDVNSDIVENYGGADYEVSPSEFDAINHKYDLTGKRAARSIADAVWAAMPVGKPYCIDRIDLDALNDTSPAREAGVAFRLPDYVYEAQMAEEEARRIGYGQAEAELPDWVTEHEREPHRVFPPLPSFDDIVPIRLTLEEREPGVETYSINPAERIPRSMLRGAGVLAGAYKGKDIGQRTTLTHAVSIEPIKVGRFARDYGEAFCNRKIDLVDEGAWEPLSHVTCPKCLEIVARVATPATSEARPIRLQLEESEPGVETYSIHSNPAWVTKIIAKHFVELEDEVPPKWLPKLTKPSVSDGKMVAAMKEYGCGAYGCVLPTLDPTVVLKLTTDSTEAEFAHGLADKLSRPVVVKYHLTRALPDKYRNRDAYLLWRDSADQVGEVIQAVAERGGDVKAADKAIAKQHKAAQDAFDALHEGKPAQKLLDRWVDAADEMGRAIPELSELAKNMIAVLRKDKVFFGDVHDGNIGLVNGHWVIVDPGHVAVLQT